MWLSQMEVITGPTPGGDMSLGPAIFAVALTSYIFVVLSGSFRLLTRALLVRQLGWDDYTIGLTLVI